MISPYAQDSYPASPRAFSPHSLDLCREEPPRIRLWVSVIAQGNSVTVPTRTVAHNVPFTTSAGREPLIPFEIETLNLNHLFSRHALLEQQDPGIFVRYHMRIRCRCAP